MSEKLNQRRRRFAVVILYGGLFLFLAAFWLGKEDRNALWAIPGSLGIAAAIAGFVTAQVRTGLWRLVHSSVDCLDEREVQITRESLRAAYAIFSVFVLGLLLLLAVLEVRGCGNLGVLLPATLILSAHTLPASVLAWRERAV